MVAMKVVSWVFPMVVNWVDKTVDNSAFATVEDWVVQSAATMVTR